MKPLATGYARRSRLDSGARNLSPFPADLNSDSSSAPGGGLFIPGM